MKPLSLVYVAGAFTAPTPYGVRVNIQHAEEWSAALISLGIFPVCPHLAVGCFGGLAPESFFLAGTLELMRRCDGVLMVPGWQASRGSVAERAEALRLGIPVWEDFEDLRDLVETGREVGRSYATRELAALRAVAELERERSRRAAVELTPGTKATTPLLRPTTATTTTTPEGTTP